MYSKLFIRAFIAVLFARKLSDVPGPYETRRVVPAERERNTWYGTMLFTVLAMWLLKNCNSRKKVDNRFKVQYFFHF